MFDRCYKNMNSVLLHRSITPTGYQSMKLESKVKERYVERNINHMTTDSYIPHSTVLINKKAKPRYLAKSGDAHSGVTSTKQDHKMNFCFSLALACCAFILSSVSSVTTEDRVGSVIPAERICKPGPPSKETSGKINCLVIGDSISIGYVFSFVSVLGNSGNSAIGYR